MAKTYCWAARNSKF